MSDVYAFPFDSELTELGTEDREYGSNRMRSYFSKFVTNGVFGKNTTQLRVTSVGGMTLKISAGSCFINGATRDLPDTELTLELSDTSLRTDLVVLRFDLLQRNIIPLILTGGSIVRNDSVWDLLLAKVAVAANATSVSQVNISDQRGTSDCPYVTGLLEQIDTSGLFAQYGAEWDKQMAEREKDWNDFVAQLGDSDNVTINTADEKCRALTHSIYVQQSFADLFKVI